MRTKRNISGAARPRIERVDELQNQERSDRGYGGVRKLFVDRQFSLIDRHTQRPQRPQVINLEAATGYKPVWRPLTRAGLW